MLRFYLPLVLLLAIAMPPRASSGQSAGLAELQTMTVVIDDLDAEARSLGLREKVLADHALDLLRSKVPRLNVSEQSAEGFLLVDATLGTVKEQGKTPRYYGAIDVEVFRLVTVQKTGESLWAPVWDGQYIVAGEPGKAVEEVKETLELILSEFVARWLEENP